ncbi:unnamed protein product [Paramecium pentaurelia]|uniref:Uncharacterized protein n=1 Tax=Paramecium pentaurelia TaxID=43138 RepID=A0A8S1WUX1_9CILI|nr:unnamed protein product [Paramecium pentaurelia]
MIMMQKKVFSQSLTKFLNNIKSRNGKQDQNKQRNLKLRCLLVIIKKKQKYDYFKKVIILKYIWIIQQTCHKDQIQIQFFQRNQQRFENYQIFRLRVEDSQADQEGRITWNYQTCQNQDFKNKNMKMSQIKFVYRLQLKIMILSLEIQNKYNKGEFITFLDQYDNYDGELNEFLWSD